MTSVDQAGGNPMTPDEAIEQARWYEREDIATTLREEANVLADEVERLRERVARLEDALRLCADALDESMGDTDLEDDTSKAFAAHRAARAALEGTK